MKLAQIGLGAGIVAIVGCGTPTRNLGSEGNGAEAGETSGAGSDGKAGSGGGETNASGGKAGIDAIGDAGTAGEGGAPPAPVACKADKDCDDGLACNGTEKCVNQLCVAGTAACTNADAANCDVVCTENGASPTCAVKGKDADKDGHFSKLCAANPGDDCNDMADSVYPGAHEICDGLDNDCNGKADLADGLALGGTIAVIDPTASRFPAIAWAPEKSVFGIAFYSNANAGVYFQTLDAAGTIVTPTTLVDTPPVSLNNDIGWAWGGDAFGAAWSWDSGGGTYFRTVSSTGSLGVVRTILDTHEQGNPQVARIAGGDWGVAFSNFSTGPAFEGVTISATGAVSPIATIDASSGGFVDSGPRLASSGSNFAVALSGTNGQAIAYLMTSSLASPSPFTLQGKAPVLGSGAGGFAFATTSTASMTAPRFYSFDPNGNPICGPVDLADPTFIPAAMTATPTGYLVASSGKLRVQEVLANCTMGALFTVDDGPNDDEVGIAGGASGYGVVWSGIVSSDVSLERRVFGPKYCN